MLKQCSAMAPDNQLKLRIGKYKVIEVFFQIKIDGDKLGWQLQSSCYGLQ